MGPGEDDSDRAAILARRRLFVAVALSGLASASCTHATSPQPCLNMAMPEGEDEGADGDGGDDEGASGESPADSGVFVEDPGAPLESTDPEGAGDSGDEGEREREPIPRPCLNIAKPPPQRKKPKPQPWPCLLMVAVD